MKGPNAPINQLSILNFRSIENLDTDYIIKG